MPAESDLWTPRFLTAACVLLLLLLIGAAVWIAALCARTRRKIEETRAEMARLAAAERRLLQQQKMEAIGKLAGGVAHSFNNHLTSILGFSELLMEMILPKESCRSPIEAIHRAALKGSEFTRQLFALNRKQSMQMESLNLSALLNEISPALRSLSGDKIELRLELEEKLGQAMLDRTQTELAVSNLVSSVRDSLPDGGQLTIRTRNVDLAKPYLCDSFELKSGPYVEMTIRDNGKGMDENMRSHIFEPFFLPKQKSKGGGLALALAYSIIKQSSGEVSVSSEEGKGTTYCAYFPRV